MKTSYKILGSTFLLSFITLLFMQGSVYMEVQNVVNRAEPVPMSLYNIKMTAVVFEPGTTQILVDATATSTTVCADAGYTFNVNCFETIQKGVNAAATSSTVGVNAGIYNGALAVNKSVNLYGPNYEISPNSGTRVPEAIIMQPDGTPDNYTAMIITSNNVSINGFTFEGDNPSISGTLNAAKAIVVNNSNTVTLSNNIIENYWRAGIDADGSVSGSNTAVNILNNRMLNILGKTSGYGSAIFFGSNTTGTIDHNYILNSRRCVYFDYNPNGGVVSITNNVLDATLIGLFMNRLSQNGASTITISNNTITSTNTDVLAYNANYYAGMILTTNWNYTGNSLILSNNTLDGKFNYGILAWNNSAPINIVGGSINASLMQVAVRHEALSATWGSIYTGGGGVLTLDDVSISNAPVGVWTDDNGTGVSYDFVKTAVTNGTSITGGEVGLRLSGSTIGSTALIEGNTLNNLIFGGQTTKYIEIVNNTQNIDATNNYWGSLDPNFTTMISGNVTYDPWLCEAYPTTKVSVDGICKKSSHGRNMTWNTIAYVAGPGGTISGNTVQEIAQDQTGTEVIATPDAGHTFINWSDQVTTPNRTDNFPEQSMTLTAYFSPEPGQEIGGDAEVPATTTATTTSTSTTTATTTIVAPPVTPPVTPPVPGTPNTPPTPGTPRTGYHFGNDLRYSSVGPEVVELQKFLVAYGYLTMPAGVDMGEFGPLTRESVIKLQIAKKITPAQGYFGPKTRALVNTLSY